MTNLLFAAKRQIVWLSAYENIHVLILSGYKEQMAEWIKRLTGNLLGMSRMDSNSPGENYFIFYSIESLYNIYISRSSK